MLEHSNLAFKELLSLKKLSKIIHISINMVDYIFLILLNQTFKQHLFNPIYNKKSVILNHRNTYILNKYHLIYNINIRLLIIDKLNNLKFIKYINHKYLLLNNNMSNMVFIIITNRFINLNSNNNNNNSNKPIFTILLIQDFNISNNIHMVLFKLLVFLAFPLDSDYLLFLQR